MKAERASRVLGALALYAMLGMSAVLGAQPTKASFSISISTPQNMVKVDAPITIEATMTNTSDHDIFYAVGVPGQVIDLTVCDGSGKLVSETPYGRQIHGTDPNRRPFVGSVFRATIKASHTFQQQSDLSKEYDMTKPGKYKVQAYRRDSQTHEMVRSNTITITVTQ